MPYRLLTLLLLTCVLCTCDRATYTEASVDSYAPEVSMQADDEMRVEPPRTAEPPPPPPSMEQAVRAPKVIYTARARARVEQLDTALAVVARAVDRAGGYLSSQHRTNSNYEHTATLEIRLPAASLHSTIALLPAITAEIDYQNLDSRDVTAEWLDLESRLQTKRDVRDRYIDILRNRAQKVEDILNAEDKIRVITEEIEAKEGRLRYLRDQVSMSTFTLELYETQEYRETGETYTRSFGSKLVNALAFGWDMVQGIVLFLISIWPLLLIGGAVLWFVRRRWRRRT